MTSDFTIERLSEDALVLRFGDRIDAAVNAQVHTVARLLRKAPLPGVLDIAPAYASLLLRFDPYGTGPGNDELVARIHETLASRAAEDVDRAPGRSTIVVPVCYGDDFGPDLDAVAAHAGLSRAEAVARHTAGEYTVAMLGFAPGFPYLLGLDPALHAPRRSDPRTRVPAGSVAIGGAQTGIYPRELPGGWNLIGTTPFVLFDAARKPPALFAPGDRVRFRAIGGDEFEALQARRGRSARNETASDVEPPPA